MEAIGATILTLKDGIPTPALFPRALQKPIMGYSASSHDMAYVGTPTAALLTQASTTDTDDSCLLYMNLIRATAGPLRLRLPKY